MIACSLHNHCSFCDGENTLKEMVEAAFSAGITDFGISSHAYAPFDLDCSIKDEASYIDSVRAFIAENKLPVNIYLGTEDDYYAKIKDRKAYDYIVGGVHYIKNGNEYYPIDLSPEHQLKCVDEVFGGDHLAYARAYYEKVVEVARRKIEVLAHFDLVAKYEGRGVEVESKAYRALALDALDECLKLDSVLEINYGAVARGNSKKVYPAPFIMERIAEKKGKIILSTDCHDAKNIDFGLCEGEEYARSFGITEVVVLRDGKWTTEKIKM